MSWRNTIFMVMIIALLNLSVVGCEKEGTAEKAGKKIDNAIKSAKETIEKKTSD